jgi:hypothetical protein
VRNNSNSKKRSGDRERKNSNSRSPSQPLKARIPKVSLGFLTTFQKKEFSKMGSEGQFMAVTTGG